MITEAAGLAVVMAFIAVRVKSTDVVLAAEIVLSVRVVRRHWLQSCTLLVSRWIS